MRRVRTRLPSPALIISVIALLVALGGTSYAALNSLPKNSVGTKQLKNNAVTTSKIANGAVTGAKVKLSTLGTVPSATNAGHATSADSATPNVPASAMPLRLPRSAMCPAYSATPINAPET